MITKLKINAKATNYCPVRYNFVNILLILTFSSGFKTLEIIKMIMSQSSAAQNRSGTCKCEIGFH